MSDDHPFYLSPAQLRMVSDSIMAEARRKYDLRPRQNVSNLRRDDAGRGGEGARRDPGKGIESPRREASLKASNLKRPAVPIKEELKATEQPNDTRVAGAGDKPPTSQ